MIIKYLYLLSIFFAIIFSKSFNNNSIYNAGSSSYGISLGGIHFLSSNIDGVFKQAFDLDSSMKNNLYYSNQDKFNGSINLVQFGYCVNHDTLRNFSIGLLQRSINDNFHTSSSWTEDVDGPSFDEIDYNQIELFSDNELGLIFSYTSRIDNNLIYSLKVKPSFHKINHSKGYGFGADFILYNKYQYFDFILGIEELLSFKDWSHGTKEKFQSNGYICIYKNIDNYLISYEYNQFKGSIYSFDIELIDNVFFRVGYNDLNSLVGGFGIKTEFVELNYAYSNSIDRTNHFSLTFNFSKIKSHI